MDRQMKERPLIALVKRGTNVNKAEVEAAFPGIKIVMVDDPATDIVFMADPRDEPTESPTEIIQRLRTQKPAGDAA